MTNETYKELENEDSSYDIINEELVNITDEHTLELFGMDDEQWAESTPGEVLRAYRKRAGLTQKELAEQFGVSVPAISAAENDKFTFSASKLLEAEQNSPDQFCWYDFLPGFFTADEIYALHMSY